MNPPLTPPRRGTEWTQTNACFPPGRGRGWVGSWRARTFAAISITEVCYSIVLRVLPNASLPVDFFQEGPTPAARQSRANDKASENRFSKEGTGVRGQIKKIGGF